MTPSSVAKKKKVKFSRSPSTPKTSHGNHRSATAGKSETPTPTAKSDLFAVLGEKDLVRSGNPLEAQEKTSGDPAHPVEAPSPPGLQQVRISPPSLDEEEGEVTPGDADIPDSIARALLDALQEKWMGNELPAAMGPLARVRASQLQQCLAKGSKLTEAVIQATLDLIAVDQGPADPLALANTVSMVSQTPDMQLNATVPAQDSSSSFNTTARAEVTEGSLNTTIADNSNTSPTVLISGCRPNRIGHTQHPANSFRMSANDIPEQLVLRGTSDEDVQAILTQFRKRVELKVIYTFPRRDG